MARSKKGVPSTLLGIHLLTLPHGRTTCSSSMTNHSHVAIFCAGKLCWLAGHYSSQAGRAQRAQRIAAIGTRLCLGGIAAEDAGGFVIAGTLGRNLQRWKCQGWIGSVDGVSRQAGGGGGRAQARLARAFLAAATA